jgi:hypothetical protein
MPPKLAAMFTPSELAGLNIIGDEIARNGTCRLSVKELADRSQTCRRTIQNAIRNARWRGLLIVKRRRLTRMMSLPNIIIVISEEWLAWLKRRGPWEPSRRQSENKGAKWCAPQVQVFKKERSERKNVEAASERITSWDPSLTHPRAAGPP